MDHTPDKWKHRKGYGHFYAKKENGRSYEFGTGGKAEIRDCGGTGASGPGGFGRLEIPVGQGNRKNRRLDYQKEKGTEGAGGTVEAP